MMFLVALQGLLGRPLLGHTRPASHTIGLREPQSCPQNQLEELLPAILSCHSETHGGQ